MSKLSCAGAHEWEAAPSPTGGSALSCPVCGAPATVESLGAPPAVAASIGKLQEELIAIAGKNLAGLVIYGGLARRRYRPGKSDINLLILLRDVSGPALAAIAPPLRVAWRAVGVEPLILKPDEIQEAAHDFPVKFLDIKSHHLLLYGDDPFPGVQISGEQLRAQLAQSLRNLSLRLRRRHVALAHNPAAVTAMLGETVRSLAIQMASMLRLAYKEIPADDRTAAIFEAAAVAFHLDRETLSQLAELRRDDKPPPDTTELVSRTLATVSQLLHIVHQSKEVQS